MIQYLYGQSYNDARENQIASDEENSAILDARIYAAADKYMVPSLKECAKAEFADWAAKSWHTEHFKRVAEEMWEGNEFHGLHAVIEEQVAENIDRMLVSDRISFVDKGMRRGRFSADFLRQILSKKSSALSIERALYQTEKLEVHSLRKKIRDYKRAIEKIGKEMGDDAYAAYDSDESF